MEAAFPTYAQAAVQALLIFCSSFEGRLQTDTLWQTTDHTCPSPVYACSPSVVILDDTRGAVLKATSHISAHTLKLLTLRQSSHEGTPRKHRHWVIPSKGGSKPRRGAVVAMVIWRRRDAPVRAEISSCCHGDAQCMSATARWNRWWWGVRWYSSSLRATFGYSAN